MNPIRPGATQDSSTPWPLPGPPQEALPDTAPLPPSPGTPSGIRNDSNQRAAHPGIRVYEETENPRSPKRQRTTESLPQELLPVREAFPRKENEKAIQYVRRLNLASQQDQPGARVNGQPLSIPQLVSLSGSTAGHLREDPQLKPLPPELLPVRHAFPRKEYEQSAPYARRLNLASKQDKPAARVNGQPLSIAQLASLSGATETNLRLDPQLTSLPPELLSVRQAFPREENEKAIQYARRLNLASQQDKPAARVNGQPLSIAQLASLSGATKINLRLDPQLKPLPQALLPVRQAFPRKENEKAIPYARRLNLASKQDKPAARVNGISLSITQLAHLSGAKEADLHLDPQLKSLPQELLPVRQAFPRQENEKAFPYARRLNLASKQDQPNARVNGQPLSIDQLASLSGATETNLRRDPQLKPLPPELLPVRQAFPREENEQSAPYARRLNLASKQDKPAARVNGQPLSIAQLASLSGATEADLRRDPQLKPLPQALLPVRQAFPRKENEKAIPYARRLNLASQQDKPAARVNGMSLSIAQLAHLSGAKETNLRQDPQLTSLPPELLSVRQAFPRKENEQATQYARRLNLASQQDKPAARVNGQPLSINQLASLSGATAAHLREDPQLKLLPPELLPVREAFPREENEKSVPYALRLNLDSEQDQPGARVNGQPLSIAQLASLSGARESDLRRRIPSTPPESLPDRTALPRNAMLP